MIENEAHAVTVASELTAAAAAMRQRSSSINVAPVQKEIVEKLPDRYVKAIGRLEAQIADLTAVLQSSSNRLSAIEASISKDAPARPAWSVADLLARAEGDDDAEMVDPTQAAIDRVDGALQQLLILLSAGEMRYELAVQAINGNASALLEFDKEAKEQGHVTASELAAAVITNRDAALKRMMAAYRRRHSIVAAIRVAPREMIDVYTDNAIRELRKEFRWNP